MIWGSDLTLNYRFWRWLPPRRFAGETIAAPSCCLAALCFSSYSVAAFLLTFIWPSFDWRCIFVKWYNYYCCKFVQFVVNDNILNPRHFFWAYWKFIGASLCNKIRCNRNRRSTCLCLMLCYLRCGQRGFPAPVMSHWIGLRLLDDDCLVRSHVDLPDVPQKCLQLFHVTWILFIYKNLSDN